MLLLRWLLALPLGIVAGVGLAVVGMMAATGSTDGGRLSLLLLGLGVGLFPIFFAGAKRVGGVLRRSSLVLLLEAIAIPVLGFLVPPLAGRPALGPEQLQWTRQPEVFADWVSSGYGSVALAVICALIGALGLVLLIAGRSQPSAAPTRTSKESTPKAAPAAEVRQAPAAKPTPEIVSPSAAAPQRELPATPSPTVVRPVPAAPAKRPPDDDANLTSDLASLREKLARINSQQPPSGQG